MPNLRGFLGRLLHASYFATNRVWGFRRLYQYFITDFNPKKCINNSQQWPYTIKNSNMIRILMTFNKILGWLVFNLNSNPCKYDNIWATILIRRIKSTFVRVNIQISNTYFETLKDRKSRHHNFRPKVSGCENF